MMMPTTRRALIAAPLLAVSAALLSPGVFAVVSVEDTRLSKQLAFDADYIPALFLTGSAGKSPEGPAKAKNALQRLLQAWPQHRAALTALHPGQPNWLSALAAVDRHLQEADRLVAQGQWERSHEALEHVRGALFDARQGFGADYPLDRFTAYHAAMEKIDAVKSVERPGLRQAYTNARALWRPIETASFEPGRYGLSAARADQLAQALQQESAALSRLSQALERGTDAEVLGAAGALKVPFVRAYLAFGAPL